MPHSGSDIATVADFRAASLSAAAKDYAAQRPPKLCVSPKFNTKYSKSLITISGFLERLLRAQKRTIVCIFSGF
jgi:hypothetical protein